MQWVPLLLLLLLAAACAAHKCLEQERAGGGNILAAGMQNASFYHKLVKTCRSSTCVRFLSRHAAWWGGNGDYDPYWKDAYVGCYDEPHNRGFRGLAHSVHKYCEEPDRSNCNSMQMLHLDDSGAKLAHRQVYICCCHTNLCTTQEIIPFALQQEKMKPAPKPTQGPSRKVACERNMRKAFTREGLRFAEPESQPDETCDAVWAPCAEFVFLQPAKGVWRRWRAGCSYHITAAHSYGDIVEQFCTETDGCKAFEMLDPTMRGSRYVWTDAFVCCCFGTGCEMPDTVAFSQEGIEKTTAPPNTTAAQPVETSTTTAAATATSAAATTTMAAAAAASTAGAGEGSPLWLWLLLVVVVLLVAIAVVVAATIVVKQKRKVAEKRKASKDDDAPTTGSDSSSADVSKSTFAN